MSNPVQVRCNACDYYTNSAHKLQLHSSGGRHEVGVMVLRHLNDVERSVADNERIYACASVGSHRGSNCSFCSIPGEKCLQFFIQLTLLKS